jgi:uncharacterized protein
MGKPNGDKLDSSRKKAFEKLHIDPGHRVILCLDGGGMRGILTIQLLKKLEEVAEMPCHQLFDMVAGTSTGGIIAGLIVTGKTAIQIEGLYESLVKEVFDRRLLGNRFINPPAFSKDQYRAQLRDIIQDLKVWEACKLTQLDLMITSLDMAASEETFFSCFQLADGTWFGTYKELLLRAVMEATMSAPTYFYPLERFVDGGTTTYNNPAMAAFMEAVSYSYPRESGRQSDYRLEAITLFSFGTGISRQFIQPLQAVHPHGIDIMFWLNWLMTQTGQDASAMQVDTFRSPMIKEKIDFRRFEISLDPDSIRKIPSVNTLDEHKYGTPSLDKLGKDILGNIDMSDITRFDLMQVIGQQMAEYIMESGGGFTKDLADENGNDLLVTAFGDIQTIQKQMSQAAWLDGFKS